MVDYLHGDAGGEVVGAAGDVGGYGHELLDGGGLQGAAVEPVHYLAGQGRRQNAVLLPERGVEQGFEFGKQAPAVVARRGLCQGLAQGFEFGRPVFELGGQSGRVGVVQAAQGVLEIDVVVVVADHPGRVLGGDEQVEVGEVQFGEAAVAGHDFGKVALGRGYLEEFHLVAGVAAKGIEQAPPEALGATHGVGNGGGCDDADFHGAPSLSSFRRKPESSGFWGWVGAVSWAGAEAESIAEAASKTLGAGSSPARR